MKLSYRGIEYNYTPHTLPTENSEVIGKYRGHTLYFHEVKEAPEPHEDLELKYRGVPYHTH